MFTRQIDQLMRKSLNNNKSWQKMVFENLSPNVSSLYLFINSTQIEGAISITCFGINLTLHLKWSEHCKSLVSRANKRGYQLWRLSQINIDEEC